MINVLTNRRRKKYFYQILTGQFYPLKFRYVGKKLLYLYIVLLTF